MKIKAKISDGNNEWCEEFADAITDPVKYMTRMIDNFNDSLRPGEKARKLISVEVLDLDSLDSHDFRKQNAVTIKGYAGRMYDRYVCTRCGVSGRRHGVGDIVREPEFKAMKYSKCGGRNA